MNHRAGLAALVSAVLVCGCCKEKQPADETPVATPSETAPVAAVRPEIPERAVPSSFTPDDEYWIKAFRFSFPSDAKMGAAFAEARAACLNHQLDLCTADQWEIACRAEPAVGKAESWTISPAPGSNGWQLRGGKSCVSKSASTDGSASTNRIGLCCERRAAIHGTSRREKVLDSGQVYVDIVEKAQNAGEPMRVVKLLADQAKVHKNYFDKDAVRNDLEGDLRRWPQMDSRHTRCEYESKGSDGSFTCEVVMTRLPAGTTDQELAVFRSRYRFEQFKYTVFAEPVTMVRSWGPY